MILGIAGSRNFNDYKLFQDVIDTILGSYLKKESIDHIISGGAIGTDILANIYSKEKDIQIINYYPQYRKYGRYIAPIMRNEEIVKDADFLIIFWDEKSRGTKTVINFCNNYETDYIIYLYEKKHIQYKRF